MTTTEARRTSTATARGSTVILLEVLVSLITEVGHEAVAGADLIWSALALIALTTAVTWRAIITRLLAIVVGSGRSLSLSDFVARDLTTKVIVVRWTAIITLATLPLRPITVLLLGLLLLLLRSTLAPAPRAATLLFLSLRLAVSFSL